MASAISRNGGGVVESGLLHLAHQLRLAYRALSRNDKLLSSIYTYDTSKELPLNNNKLPKFLLGRLNVSTVHF